MKRYLILAHHNAEEIMVATEKQFNKKGSASIMSQVCDIVEDSDSKSEAVKIGKKIAKHMKYKFVE